MVRAPNKRGGNNRLEVCYSPEHYGYARIVNYFRVPRHAEPSHDSEYASVLDRDSLRPRNSLSIPQRPSHFIDALNALIKRELDVTTPLPASTLEEPKLRIGQWSVRIFCHEHPNTRISPYHYSFLNSSYFPRPVYL